MSDLIDCDCVNYCKRSGVTATSSFWVPYIPVGLGFQNENVRCKKLSDNNIPMRVIKETLQGKTDE